MHAKLGGSHVPCLDPAKGQDPCWECQDQGVHYSAHKSNLKEASNTHLYTLNGEYLSQFLNNDFLDFHLNFH